MYFFYTFVKRAEENYVLSIKNTMIVKNYANSDFLNFAFFELIFVLRLSISFDA